MTLSVPMTTGMYGRCCRSKDDERNKTDKNDDDDVDDGGIRYCVTGLAAHGRIAPLLPSDWINVSPYNNTTKTKTPHLKGRLNFLWENAPRREHAMYRDSVQCYSHLPFGTQILDSKWALARLFSDVVTHQNHDRNSQYLATLETLCFRGKSGMERFGHHVGLLSDNNDTTNQPRAVVAATTPTSTSKLIFPDLLASSDEEWNQAIQQQQQQQFRPNLWVIKDAASNGAGGIWVVSPESARALLMDQTSLMEEHKYVAQRYVWPMVLYGGRKCHVRVYALITADGRAFCHEQAFLHVANQPFQTTTTTTTHETSIHITNCCANSHDAQLFAGEICANLNYSRQRQRNDINNDSSQDSAVGLAEFAPSIHAAVTALCERASPYLLQQPKYHVSDGGGFEYLGLDFILSMEPHNNIDTNRCASFVPKAYLLEVNAPPSQDTATGLPHAEALHSTVLRDLITLWVLPHVQPDRYTTPQPGGWHCVYTPPPDFSVHNHHPSKPIKYAKAILWNRFKWALIEQKACKRDALVYSGATTKERKEDSKNPIEEEDEDPAFEEEATIIRPGTQIKTDTFAREATTTTDSETTTDMEEDDVAVATALALQARTHFAYYQQQQQQPCPVFMENAGGSQVPQCVVDRMIRSLQRRHRAVQGKTSESYARTAVLELVGASSASNHAVYWGANASTLLSLLARNCIVADDDEDTTKRVEVVICVENHLAHVTPWLDWVQRHDMRKRRVNVIWCRSWTDLRLCVTPHTCIVALSHASNVVGQVRDLAQASQWIHDASQGRALCIVDGVAAVPHVHAALDTLEHVHAYVISCHKVFGPHMGALICRRPSPTVLSSSSSPIQIHWDGLELGTVNYEACEGVSGIVDYMKHVWNDDDGGDDSNNMIRQFYQQVRRVERVLVQRLLHGLSQSSRVHFLSHHHNGDDEPNHSYRLPVVSFWHELVDSPIIVQVYCQSAGIVCRAGTFLSTSQLLESVPQPSGMVRVSLVHYNTVADIERLLQCLYSIPNWF